MTNEEKQKLREEIKKEHPNWGTLQCEIYIHEMEKRKSA